ncbi:unnamed protein product [Ectocarpus sp. CCAP 1310/34]|nr:unnamed protein product [Ectocarpus sp. CCAP 1310/34]
MNPVGYAPLRGLPLGAMFSLVVVLAGSVASAATVGSISARTTSGNAGLRSGKACDPGDADCFGDERDDSSFLGFACICCMFLLFVVFRTLRVATMWARVPELLYKARELKSARENTESSAVVGGDWRGVSKSGGLT